MLVNFLIRSQGLFFNASLTALYASALAVISADDVGSKVLKNRRGIIVKRTH